MEQGMSFSYHYSQSTGAGLEVQPSTAAATALATAKTAESLPAPSKGCWHQHIQQLWVAPAVLTAPVTACSPARPRCPQPGPWWAGPLAPCHFDSIWTIHCQSHSMILLSPFQHKWFCDLYHRANPCVPLPLPIAQPGHRSLLPLQMSLSSSQGFGGSGREGISRPKPPSWPHCFPWIAMQCSGMGAETSPVANVSKETSAPGTPMLALSSQPIPLFPAQLSSAQPSRNLGDSPFAVLCWQGGCKPGGVPYLLTAWRGERRL